MQSPFRPLERYHLGAGLQAVQVVSPLLHHLPTFGQVRRSVVCPAVRVPDSMGKLMLNKVGPDLENFIKNGARHCPESVASHFIGCIPHAP